MNIIFVVPWLLYLLQIQLRNTILTDSFQFLGACTIFKGQYLNISQLLVSAWTCIIVYCMCGQ